MRLLLVEDDPMIGQAVLDVLRAEHYAVDWVRDGEMADTALRSATYDLMLLDLGLPRRDGLQVLRDLRARRSTLPVLVATARDAVSDRVAGLDAGADDYVVKPFDTDELLARVRALLRRVELAQPAPLTLDDLVIDPQTRSVTRAGARLDLTPKEYAILILLVTHAGEIVSRAQLAEHIWHADLIAIDNLIDVHMKNLRRKLDPPGMTALIQTVRGQGFRISPSGAL